MTRFKLKTLVTTTIFLILLIPSIALAEYWGSKNSNKYHYPSCEWAQKINPKNLIKFNTPEDAIKAGYISCKVCRPPITSK